MNRRLQIIKYILLDLVASALAWGLYFNFRKIKFEGFSFSVEIMKTDDKFWQGILGISFLWILFYALTGTYRKIYKKSRILELGKTIVHSFIGVLLIFFIFILDDFIQEYSNYYKALLFYFSCQVIFVYAFRFVLLTITNRKIHNKDIGFPTILIGNKESAIDLFLKLENSYKSSGNKFIGYTYIEENQSNRLDNYLSCLGEVGEIENLIKKHKIEEVVIAIESKEHHHLESIINKLEVAKVEVKVLPTMYDILIGSVKVSSLFDVPLLNIQFKLLPVWQSILKRMLDIVISSLVLVLLSPFYLACAVFIKLGSKGGVFYKQERVGLNERPFKIIKFRSMYIDAEEMGPQLSSENDPRITKWGRIMRKYRLDEFPQFFNVLIGDMSIVGPRPERQYYIDQIVQKAPYYRQILKVKPGITSWGMVKFGYAENIDEMIERLRFDIIYIENLSLLNDFKVLVYTIVIVLQGRGK
jgi:exopolysaccharide biosynthesis polyprenyl glycosylphosphotransferase